MDIESKNYKNLDISEGGREEYRNSIKFIFWGIEGESSYIAKQREEEPATNLFAIDSFLQLRKDEISCHIYETVKSDAYTWVCKLTRASAKAQSPGW